MNPRQMQGMMKKMGIAQEAIDAEEVIIKKSDGTKIVISDPEVMKIKIQGQSSYQISGEEREESEAPKISEDDIKTVMEKTGCSEEEATKALEKTGDLAEAILELS